MSDRSFVEDTVEIVSPKDSSKKRVINKKDFDSSKHTLWAEKDFISAAEVAEEPKKRRGRPPKVKNGDNSNGDKEKSSDDIMADEDDPGPIWGVKVDG